MVRRKSRLCIVAAALSVVMGGLSGYGQEPGDKPLTKAAIEQIIKEYILKNPEVLLDSVRQYQEREQASQKQRSKDAVAKQQNELLRDPASPATRPATAKTGEVTIVEFFDYRCGYCKKVNPTLIKVLAANPDVRLVFKEFPILGPESTVAAKAGLAADKQGKYVQFHQAMMAASAVNEAGIEQVAKLVGLDIAKLKTDMQSPEIAAAIEKNHELASAVGVTATPTFVIGSEMVAGAIDAQAFQGLIAKAQPKKPDDAKP